MVAEPWRLDRDGNGARRARERRRADRDLLRRKDPHGAGDDTALLRPGWRGSPLVNLDFMTPRLTDGAPPAESPMLSAATRSGATIGLRQGWLVPVGFGDEADQRRAIVETVGYADASALPKMELHGQAELLARCAGGLTLGMAMPYEGAWWCPLTPTRVLVLGGRSSTSELG